MTALSNERVATAGGSGMRDPGRHRLASEPGARADALFRRHLARKHVRVEDVALVGPREKVLEDLEAWRSTCLTTMLVSGPPALLEDIAALVG